RVITKKPDKKKSEEFEWKQPTAKDDSIASDGKTVSKKDVHYVVYVRFKPLTSTEEYFLQESAGFLAPGTWFDGLFRGKIDVLLYNSELAEDNSYAECHY